MMKRLFFVSLVLTACNTEFFDAEGIGGTTWSPTIAVPVGYGEYSFQELIEEADSLVEIQEDDNKFITLVYEQQLISESAADFVAINDQSFNETFNIDIPTPVVAPDVSFQVEEAILFDYDAGVNSRVDSIFFDSGDINLEVTSTIKAEVNATITLPNILVDGEPLTFNLNLDNFGGASVTESIANQLDQFKINLKDNAIEMVFLLDITTYGAPVSSSDYLSINFDINNLSFESFFGNVGSRELEIEDEKFTYDIFEEFNLGEIFFADPRMIFTVENSFGLPVAFDLSGIYAEDPQDGRIDLEGSIVTSPQQIGAPDFTQIGQSVTSVISINNENSNFNEIVSTLPTLLNLPINAATNPNGETQNFVTSDSRVDINLVAELPLDFRILGLKHELIFDFDGGDIEGVERALLKINTENGFPLEGKVRIIFKNELGDELLEISPNGDFESPLFAGAPVDNDGFVTEPATTLTDILLLRTELDQIENATEVAVEIELNTTNAINGQNVKLLSDYKVKVSLGLEASLVVDIDEE